MITKKVIGKIHLWLGLSSGLVVIISILPASVFVWEEELTDWHYSDYIYTKPESKLLPLSELAERAQETLPEGRRLDRVLIQNDSQRAYLFRAYKRSDNPGLTWFSEIEYNDHVYVNPYTGEVTGTVDAKYDWIKLCRILHQYMLLNTKVGYWPIAITTLIGFIMILTGLVLWWPRNRKAAKQRIWFRWKSTTRWKRKNYDLHNIGGFYAHLLILIMATTGLVWSFDWWQDGIYVILGDNPDTIFEEYGKVPPPERLSISEHPLDLAFTTIKQRRPSWTSVAFELPSAYTDSLEIMAYPHFDINSAWSESDYNHFNAGTGALKKTLLHEDKTLGEKWRNSNYDIHTGAIWGWPTKVLATFGSLVYAFLPISGFLIWYGRKYKKRKGRPKRRKKPVVIKQVEPNKI